MHDRSLSPEVPTAYQLYLADALSGDPRMQQMEDSFFHSLGMRNGTLKTTWHRRLDDLNALIERFLPPDRPLEIMDVAISSGISTVEWLESLERAGIECRITAGDAIVHGFLLTAGPVRALMDRTGFVMQLDIGGKAIRMPPPRRRDRLRYGPLLLSLRAAARLFADTLGCAAPPEAVRARFGVSCRPLKLVTRSLRTHPRIEVVEDDILTNSRWPGRFHILRAANVLNRCYFDEALLERMLRNLRTRLAPRGLLAVCRTTEEGRNDATLLRLREDRAFEPLATLNAGSEVTQLALSLGPEPQPE